MASKYYNPNLAKGIAGAQSKQYVNYGKDFAEGFKPSMDALQAAKQKQLDDAAKQEAINAANALKQNQARQKTGLELMEGISDIVIDEKGILENFKPAAAKHLTNVKRTYSDNITNEMSDPELGFDKKVAYQEGRNALKKGVVKYGDSLKRVSASIGEISEAVNQGYLSSANGPEEAALFNSLVNTLQPSDIPGKYTYKDTSGKTVEIDEEGIEDLKKEFVYVTAKDYNSILDEGDKIAKATKTTKDGKVYYDFNPAQKERLKFSILQKLDDKNTGNDFLFDTLSNTELSVGPLSLYPNMTKAEIKKQAEEEMVANEIPANLINDKSIMSFLKEKVANGYLKTFENTYPGPPAETESVDEPTDVDTAFGLITEKVGQGPEGIIELTNQWKEDLSTEVVMDGSNLVIASNQGEIIQKVNLKDKNEVKNFLGQLIKKQYGSSSMAQKLKTKLSGIDLSGIGNEFKASTDEALSAIEKIQRVKNKIK